MDRGGVIADTATWHRAVMGVRDADKGLARVGGPGAAKRLAP